MGGLGLTLVLGLAVGCLAGCSLGTSAAEAPCHADRLQESPGLLLPLTSGLLYEAYPTDNRISMAWLPLDKLTVCPIGGGSVEITNLSRRSQRVKAFQIFFLPWVIQQQSS